MTQRGSEVPPVAGPIKRLAAAARPARLARHVVAAPLVALALGAASPSLADAARPGLGPVVLMLVFACVAAGEVAPPTRREARTALLMLAATAAVCPAAVAAIAVALRLPGDLALGAVLAAASPAAISAGVLSRRFGLPDRPPVWAALGGLALGPLLLPTAAAAVSWWCADAAGGGAPAPVSPRVLAERAALFGALPAAAAFALRRAAPGAAAALAPDLRGAAVLALAAVGLCAGGTLSATLAAIGAAGGGVVLAVAVAAQATAAGAAWSTGRLARGADREGFGGRPLLVVGVARNASFVWAAAAGALTVRGEAVLALAVAGTYLLPLALLAAAPLGRAVGRLPNRRRPAWGAEVP